VPHRNPLGNAVIAITEENNRLFPQRRVNESKIATPMGLMNMLSASVGGVPAMGAGHVQFGARTGGALVILCQERPLGRRSKLRPKLWNEYGYCTALVGGRPWRKL